MADSVRADAVARDPVLRALLSDERVIWRAKAHPWKLATSKALVLVFALVWACFAWSMLAFIVVGSATGGAPMAMAPAFAILGLFSLFGVVLVVGAVADFVACWSTHYALTDRRVLIASSISTQSFNPSAFATTQVCGSRESGSIGFAWGPMGRSGVGFTAWLVGVHEPHRVIDVIRRTLDVTS